MRPYGCRSEAHPPQGALAADPLRSTTFAYPSAEELRAVGAGETDGEFYPRYGHPAGRLFESRVAELERADGAVAFASGMAAIHATFFALLRAGDTAAIARDVYGGTSALLPDLRRFGVEIVVFDPFDDADTTRALAARPRLIHVETPTNPLCRVLDIEALAARRGNATLTVDATFAPPPLQRLLGRGADLVVHSATKFLGGHHDLLAGVVAGRHELLDPIEKFRRRSGGVLAPDVALLAARSTQTLELRVRAAAATAARLAPWLEERVRRVFYPGLASHPDHAVARRQMDGFGAILAIEVEGGLEGAARVYDRLRVIARAVSLGGVESSALLPLHTSHAMVTAEDRTRAGIADGTIRLSIGLEAHDVLRADLEQALP